LALWFGLSDARAQNDTLEKLLPILRDRGSITPAEYDELRKSIDSKPAPTANDARAREQSKEQQKIIDQTVSSAIKETLTGKWYERIALRGYTQFRFSSVFSEAGPPLEAPADRSVNPNESLVIRRVRFIFSGDISDHFYLYAQYDFNGSTGTGDFALQNRDLYADIALDKDKEFRFRLGQSKVPFGWVNLQSSQNRAALERPDALNSAAEGERDLGAYFMWAPASARQRFRELVSKGFKGSGDYGVIAGGIYSGQGPNRGDQNGEPHGVLRASYPFQTAGSQLFELGVQAHYGRFVTTTQAITDSGVTFTPVMAHAKGEVDQRVAFSAIWYPQPIGFEAEWTFGRGPELSPDLRRIESKSLMGGYAQLGLRHRATGSRAVWYPFTRWSYFDGARKFARNSPKTKVNELDFGLEVAPWTEVEMTLIYTHTFQRTRTGSFPYDMTRGADRVGIQVQWNY
jgi:hypothetical protein